MYATDISRQAMAQLLAPQHARLERFVGVQCYYHPPIYINHQARPGQDAQVNELRLPTLHYLASKIIHHRRGWELEAQALPSMVDHMLAVGSLAIVDDPARGRLLRHAVVGGMDGSARERGEIYRHNMVERIAGFMPAEVRAQLATLFHRIRQAQQVHATRSDNLVVQGKRVAFALSLPDKITVGGMTPVVEGCTVLAIMDTGCLAQFKVPARRLVLSYPDGDGQLVADLKGLRNCIAKGGVLNKVLPEVSILENSRPLVFDWPAIQADMGTVVPPRVQNSFERALKRRVWNACSQIAQRMLRRELCRDTVSHLCRSMPGANVAIYNWLAANPGSPRRARRIQALASYPLLGCLIASNPELRRMVDNATPIAPLLGTLTGFTPAVLRRVGKLYWQRTGAQVFSMASRVGHRVHMWGVLTRCLNACPIQRLPHRRAEWAGFTKLVDALGSVGYSLYDDPMAVFENRGGGGQAMGTEAVVHHSRDWLAARLLNGDSIDYACSCAHLFVDLLRNHADPHNAMAGVAWLTLRDACRQALFVGARPTFRTTIERNRLWHARTNALRTSLDEASRHAREGVQAATQKTLPPPRTWPALDYDYACQEGSITWLCDAQALGAETEVMGHCVWGYTPNCLYYGSHIGAVRAGDGTRSTVELVCRADAAQPGGMILHEVQHRALRNARPSPACQALVRQYLLQRSAHIDYLALSAALEQRKLCMPVRSWDEHYAWNSPEFRQAVLDLHRPYLCREAAELDLDGIAALVGVALRDTALGRDALAQADQFAD